MGVKIPLIVTDDTLPDPVSVTGVRKINLVGLGLVADGNGEVTVTGGVDDNITGSIAANQVAYGTAVDEIGGSAEFMFTPSSASTGATLEVSGEKPYLDLADTTGSDKYVAHLHQSGASFYLAGSKNDATEYQSLRIDGTSTGWFQINPQQRDKNTVIRGMDANHYFLYDAGEGTAEIRTLGAKDALRLSNFGTANTDNPVLNFYSRNSHVDGDQLGTIIWSGRPDDPSELTVTFARIETKILDNTGGTYDGQMQLKVISDSVTRSYITLGGEVCAVDSDLTVSNNAEVSGYTTSRARSTQIGVGGLITLDTPEYMGGIEYWAEELGTVVLTLPGAAKVGSRFSFFATNTQSITIQATSGDFINGVANFAATRGGVAYTQQHAVCYKQLATGESMWMVTNN